MDIPAITAIPATATINRFRLILAVPEGLEVKIFCAALIGCEDPMFPPDRTFCLTEETAGTLYLLGEQDRIVGISGYVVRTPQARREKPRVSAFTSANIDKILALKPDLVLTFSDLQVDIAADLVPCSTKISTKLNQR
jgi:ABC-type hemin transport system substrate-binding protein